MEDQISYRHRCSNFVSRQKRNPTLLDACFCTGIFTVTGLVFEIIKGIRGDGIDILGIAGTTTLATLTICIGCCAFHAGDQTNAAVDQNAAAIDTNVINASNDSNTSSITVRSVLRNRGGCSRSANFSNSNNLDTLMEDDIVSRGDRSADASEIFMDPQVGLDLATPLMELKITKSAASKTSTSMIGLLVMAFFSSPGWEV